MARGLMIYPSGGNADGINGDHVLIAPPFIAESAEFDFLAQQLRDGLAAF